MIKLQAVINRTKRDAILKPLVASRGKLFISTHAGHYIVEKLAINFVKADSNYCELHMNDERKIVCSKTLKDVASRLPLTHFVRTHQSYMVNLQSIAHINAGFTEVTLSDGSCIPISRSNRCELKSRMLDVFD